MILKNYYWYFKSALTNKFCNDVIEFGNSQKDHQALTGNFQNKKIGKKEIKDLKKQRNSNVAWLNQKWIFKEILPYIDKANVNAEWNYEIDFAEECQFTKYALNQHYGWHCDSYPEPYKNHPHTNYNGRTRKLSVTCSLSDPENYKGGELEFNFNNPEKKKRDNIKTCNEILPKGSIIVFPSFVWHRVKPVIEGTRYSLVIWSLGYPFK